MSTPDQIARLERYVAHAEFKEQTQYGFYVADVKAVLAALADATQSHGWLAQRLDALQQQQGVMRDPERKMVCDILANGRTYATPATVDAPPTCPHDSGVPPAACGWCADDATGAMHRYMVWLQHGKLRVAVFMDAPDRETAQEMASMVYRGFRPRVDEEPVWTTDGPV